MRKPKRPPDIRGAPPLSAEKSEAFYKFKSQSKIPYWHWDELVRREPPPDLTHSEFWATLKLWRRFEQKLVPLYDTTGASFWYVLSNHVLELLNYIDRRSGNPTGAISRTSPEHDRYYISSLMEEATASSRLEGAMMAVPKAKEMLRTGREPRNASERMILNNYLTMKQIETLKDRPLTPELVFEIHKSITDGTLEDPDSAGRLRLPVEKIEVVDRLTMEIAHIPPPAEELERRLANMCAFANRKLDMNEYMPPIVRAIILHFWLAYDHPFVDGNGRTARALFYWSALRDGYELFRFLSISSVILDGPAKYSRAFLYTESDDNDLTYFILYHLEIIRRSLEQLDNYIERKLRDLRNVEQRMRGLMDINHRQKALLIHALRHPHQHYTFDSHATSHNVVKQTARTDLLSLHELGLLRRGKEGRQYYFVAVEDLGTKLESVGVR